jgi:UDP-N-acetylmuramoyl-tripeptide--D-alanyl-D-alanine ligase
MFSEGAKLFSTHIPAPGRMRVLKGINGATIIDDSYNSSPVAVQAGLNALNTVQINGRRIIILGDMLELGDYSVREHESLGQVVATTADIFISVGVRMLAAAEAALAANARCKKIESFQTSIEALPVIKEIIGEGDLVFIKGSQGMRMERIVENLLHDQHTAVNVLCRQDPHWKVRA